MEFIKSNQIRYIGSIVIKRERKRRSMKWKSWKLAVGLQCHVDRIQMIKRDRYNEWLLINYTKELNVEI